MNRIRRWLYNLKGTKAKRSGFNFNFNHVDNSEWNPQLRPPQSFIRDSQEQLIARCRNIADTDAYGAGIVSTFRAHVVTDKGITLQNISDDLRLSTAIDTHWKRYAEDKMNSVNGTLDMRELQLQCVSSFLSDGEVFIRKHYQNDTLRYELIDPPRIPYQLLTKTNKGQHYENGILVNTQNGQIIGYRVNDVGSDNYRLGNSLNNAHGKVIPADEVIHVAMGKRIGQLRGTPLLKAVAGRIFKISQYENAVLENATSSAKKYGFFTWDKDAEHPPDIELEFSPSKSKSGSFHELPSGLNLDSYESQFPTDELGGFTRAILLSTARALGVSYPTLSGDLSDVNYASIRQAVLAERTLWSTFREFVFQSVVYPIFKEYMTQQVSIGAIRVGRRTLSLADLTEILKVVGSSVHYAEIDPRNENIVETARLQNLTYSPSEIIQQRGGDPEETWKQIAKDIQAMLDAGIPSTFVNDLFLRQPFAVLSLEQEGLLPRGNSNE